MDGKRWNDLSPRLLWAYEGPVPKEGHGRQGVSPSYFAWLLLEGEARFSFNKRESASLEAGAWGFPPPGAKDRLHRFSPDAKLLSLQFSLEWPGGRTPFKLTRFLSFAAKERPELTREAKRLVRLAKGSFDFPLNAKPSDCGFGRYAAVQAGFWRWLALWTEALESHGVREAKAPELDERVERMLDALREERLHGPVPYAKLEKAASLGKVQIDRLFKEQLGASPKSVFERHLARLCMERLQSSTLSVKELSEEFGFGHPANFCAWFARRTGRTPQSFRRGA